MGFFAKPLFLSTIVLLLIINSGLSTPYIGYYCYYGDYTTNSTYQDNLNSLLFALSLSTRGQLDKQFVGWGPDRVYGLYQCRGADVSSEICRKCVDDSTKEILVHCPNSKGAIIWVDECMVRYSDKSFFSIMQDSPVVYLVNPDNITNPDQFNPILVDLLDDLVTKAVSGSSNNTNTTLFATGERNVTSFQKVYGIVQCTVDIKPSSCNTCLRGAVAQLSACCDGKKGGRVITPSCDFRYEIYPFTGVNGTKEAIQVPSPPPSPSPSPSPLPLPLPLPSSPSPSTNGTIPNGTKNKTDQEHNKARIYMVVIPVVVAVLVIAFTFSICLLRRKATKERGIMQTSVIHQEGAASSPLRYYKHNEAEGNGIDVPFVDFDTILTATDNFSNSNKLGQGGFGPVYKGTFRGGQEMAVKRLSKSSGQGLEEFRNEVLLIAKLQHRNLVKLLGYCIKEEEKVLLYEYMANKSLDSFIFDRTLCLLINWEKRLDIILGIARGILYLHQDSRLRIIHRDLKTSNILLDEGMNPKVSDFGLARICGGTQTEGNTNRVVGTYGYMAPEYALDGIFSVKSDVYSFGVVLLEIISGKKNSGFHVSEDSLSLIGHAWRLWNENKVLQFIDSSLCEACKADEVLKCIQVGLLCVQEDANDRPTMFSVVFMLGGEATYLPTPKQPAFFFRRYQSTTTTSSSRPESCSKNEITVSAEEGR